MGELASAGQLQMAVVRRTLITVPLIVLLGFVSSAISNSGDSNAWYAALDKPWFQPPTWAFPVAWTALYVLIALALAIVLAARGSRFRTIATVMFAVQFTINLAWSQVFFGMHQPRAALFVLAAMLGAALATTVLFFRVRRSAGLMMLPYLAWLCFAGALNWEIIRLNPNADGLVVRHGGTQIQLRR